MIPAQKNLVITSHMRDRIYIGKYKRLRCRRLRPRRRHRPRRRLHRRRSHLLPHHSRLPQEVFYPSQIKCVSEKKQWTILLY